MDREKLITHMFKKFEYIKEKSYVSKSISNNDIYDIYFDHENELSKFLSYIKGFKNNEIINSIFSFKVDPNIEPEKIHVLSTIIGLPTPDNYFVLRRVNNLKPVISDLQDTFKDILLFIGDGVPCIEIWSEWKGNLKHIILYGG